MNWQVRSLLAESWQNLRSAALRSVVTLALAAALLGALAALELRDSDDALSFAQEYRESGGYLAVAEAASGGRVDAGACEALNSEPQVVAAGAVWSNSLVTFAQAPGSLFSRAPVTEGVLRVWAPGTRAPSETLTNGFAAGPALAKELGLREGSYTAAVGGEPVRMVAVLPVEQRNPQAARWFLDVQAPSGDAQQCWVEFEPGSFAAGEGALAAWFADDGVGPAVRPYLRADQFTRDPVAEFAGRPQKTGWTAAGVLLAALFWLMTWFRRGELGLYLALGTPRTMVAFMQAAEGWVLVAAVEVAAVVYALAVYVALDRPLSFDQAVVAARTSGSGALVALALIPLGPLVIVRGSILELLKDR